MGAIKVESQSAMWIIEEVFGYLTYVYLFQKCLRESFK